MSADRRTLVIAAVAMVVLIAVGVASAAVFTTSACEALQPEEATPGMAGSAVDAVLAEALGADPEDLGPGAAELVGVDDPSLVGAAEVGPAESLARVDDGVVAVGDRLTRLTGPVRATRAATVDDEARVVGDGAALYSLAVANDLTGRVDGIVPVDAGLEGGACDDTASVGDALAFHLAAGDGQLLLFRIADDAEDPALELRDRGGTRWEQEVALGAGSPGELAEDLDAVLQGDLVVTARRSRAGEDAPAVQALDRATGEERWSLQPDTLAELAPAGEESLEPAVVGVTEDLVLLTLSRGDRDQGLLVALDAGHGTARWTSDLDVEGEPVLVGEVGEDLAVLASRQAEDDGPPTRELARVGRESGESSTLYAQSGEQAHAAVIDDTVLIGVDGALTVVRPETTPRTVATGAAVRDVLAVDGRAAVLLRYGDAGVVVWAAP